MAMKINKKVFIDEINKILNYSEEQYLIIINILENHFLIGNKNKQRIIKELENKLNISYHEANNIYNVSIEIIIKKINKIFNKKYK